MHEAESLAGQLRRLHEEATGNCLCGLPTCEACRRKHDARTTLERANAALADLVEAVEARGCIRCKRFVTALAAMRAALEVGRG